MFEELKEGFRDKKVHPSDLKANVTSGIDCLLEDMVGWFYSEMNNWECMDSYLSRMIDGSRSSSASKPSPSNQI